MRKLFSLIAAVLFAGSMMATTVTKTVEELATANSWANGTVVTPFALDEVISVSTEATDANTGKYYTSGQQIRLYQTGAAKMIISAAEGYTISSITVEYVSEKGGIFAEAASGVAVPFENVQSATFTVANSGEATNGQARVTSISVTYDGGAVPPTPTVNYYVAGSMGVWGPDEAYRLTPSNNGEYEGEFTFAANDEFKVIGYDGTTVTWFPEGMDNNYVITEAGDYKITFNPAGNVEGWYAGYFNVVKKEEPVVTPITCAEVYLKEKDAAVALNDVVVTYVNGKNVWVKDATGAMLLYLAANATWSAGDVLAGVEGVVDIYNGLYEVKPSADQVAAVVATPGEAPEPELLTVITDADVNKFIIIEGVTAEGEFVEGTASNITITMGDATYTLRNNFKNAYTFEAGSTYTVWAIVSYYKTGIQLYFIDAEDEGGGPNYDYEPTEASTFDVTIASVNVQDYVADLGVIVFELEDADGAYFAYLELISSTSEPATGTYPINFTEQDGTFYASPGGDDQYDYGCYFGVVDGEYYYPYYMVSGSVVIAEDGLTVNATSYNGSTIKLTYKAQEEAIDNTQAEIGAVKFLKNGQLLIKRNNKLYNANGAVVR